jgi:hypothetical protein
MGVGEGIDAGRRVNVGCGTGGTVLIGREDGEDSTTLAEQAVDKRRTNRMSRTKKGRMMILLALAAVVGCLVSFTK